MVKITDYLEPNERVELEADAAFLKIGILQIHRGGSIALTNLRLLWVGRSPWFSVIPFYKWKRTVSIPLEEIQDIKFRPRTTWFALRHAGLSLRGGSEHYEFRMGEGPFPFVRHFEKTTERWYHTIEAAVARTHSGEREAQRHANPSP